MRALRLLKRAGGLYNVHHCLLLSGSARFSSWGFPSPVEQSWGLPALVCGSGSLHQTGRKLSHRCSHEANSIPITHDELVWESYHSNMREVITEFSFSRGKMVKKQKDLSVVEGFLLSNESYHDSPLLILDSLTARGGCNLREIFNLRKESFIERSNFSLSQYDVAMRCLVNLASVCAKTKTVPLMTIVWSKVKECGMILKPNFLATFLYIFGLDEDYADISLEIAKVHDLLYGSTENSVHLRVKALSTMGDPKGAEIVLREFPDDGEEYKRLRTFMPILVHYCSAGDAFSILRIWKEMREAPGVHIDSEACGLILGSLAKIHVFRKDSIAVQGGMDIGFSHSCGPELFDEIMVLMAKDLVEISEETAIKLYKDFQYGFNHSIGETTDIPGVSAKDLPTSKDDVDTCVLSKAEVFVGRVTIDQSTGICPYTAAKLRLITLDKHQRWHVRETLLKMAATQQKEFSARYRKHKGSPSQHAEEELRHFAEWLEQRQAEPFTAVVGANVAYFGQGNVSYSQVCQVVEALEDMGENVLVIMPRKYVNASFRLGNGVVQQLTPKALSVMTRLVNDEKMYVVPALCFDDFYWMLASVCNQNGTIPTHAQKFPGVRPMLITNDQMRDHKLELLEPRLFRRWYSSHVVTYTLSNYEHDEWEDRAVRFTPADFFSREIQGNSFERQEAIGTAWHFPVGEWKPRADRFCIALAKTNKHLKI